MEGQVCCKTFRVTHENNYYTNRISSLRLGDIRAKLISSNSITVGGMITSQTLSSVVIGHDGARGSGTRLQRGNGIIIGTECTYIMYTNVRCPSRLRVTYCEPAYL